jgi:hypothetical protein
VFTRRLFIPEAKYTCSRCERASNQNATKAPGPLSSVALSSVRYSNCV